MFLSGHEFWMINTSLKVEPHWFNFVWTGYFQENNHKWILDIYLHIPGCQQMKMERLLLSRGTLDSRTSLQFAKKPANLLCFLTQCFSAGEHQHSYSASDPFITPPLQPRRSTSHDNSFLGQLSVWWMHPSGFGPSACAIFGLKVRDLGKV